MSSFSVTDATFQKDVLQAPGPVLVYFTAPWCAPCRAMKPHVLDLAGKDSRLVLCLLDVEQSPRTPSEYAVRSIPALFLFHRGEVVVPPLVGAAGRDKVRAWLAGRMKQTGL